MTSEKIAEAIAIYRKIFEDIGVPKISFPHDKIPTEPHQKLAHCHAMLDEMEVFLKEDKREKAMRWLCFIQGVLWDYYPLNDFKEHNRT